MDYRPGTPRRTFMNGYLHEYADIIWRDALTPVSARYGDIYWSGGLEEKRHVFIHGSGLAAHFEASEHSPVIAEIGFGFGLNFLLTVQSWRQRDRNNHRRLHYIAIENQPVAPADLAALYSRLVPGFDAANSKETTLSGNETALSVDETARRLLIQYPLPTAGLHSRWLYKDVCLTLILDGVSAALDSVAGPVDVWYLDGFSPSLNEDVWNQVTYRAMARTSAPQATLSTYSTAGHVRRGLSDAGFEVERRPGFSRKAEMLQAKSVGSSASRPIRQASSTAIIGAGMAGLFCAKALAHRGVRPTVVEASEHPLSGASAIAQMAVYPQLALQPGHWNYFSLAAFQHLCASEPAMRATGFALLPESPAGQDRLARLADFFPDSLLQYADAGHLADITGLAVPSPGAVYHTGGWLDAEAAFAAVLEDLEITTRTPVSDLKREHNRWQLLDDGGHVIGDADNVIIATGGGLLPVLPTLPLSAVRGQSLTLRVSSAQPKSILGGPVTLFPPRDGLCTLSATYEPGSTDLAVRQDDTDALISKLQQMLPDLQFEIESGRVGLRSVARDRMPVVGKVPDPRAVAGWHRGRRAENACFDEHLPGLYICTGFGSHGATHAKLCAEYLTALICGEPAPLTRDWIRLLTPQRFLVTI